jgi:hypothetical protein
MVDMAPTNGREGVVWIVRETKQAVIVAKIGCLRDECNRPQARRSAARSGLRFEIIDARLSTDDPSLAFIV